MRLRSDVFQAMADTTIKAILLLTDAQSLTPGTIAANFNAAKPTASKHL